MANPTLTLGWDDRLDYARSIVALLRASLGHQQDVSLEGEAAFGLFNLLNVIQDLLTDEIAERDAKRQAIAQEEAPSA